MLVFGVLGVLLILLPTVSACSSTPGQSSQPAPQTGANREAPTAGASDPLAGAVAHTPSGATGGATGRPAGRSGGADAARAGAAAAAVALAGAGAGADARTPGAGKGGAGGAGGNAGGATASAGSDAPDAPGAGAGGDAAAPPTTHVTITAQSMATKTWWSYQRAAKYTAVTSTEKVPMRDGTPIGCTLSRPGNAGMPEAGRFPGLVVEFTPYALNANNNNAEAAFFAQRGYNALMCTLRGIGESGGTWQHAASSQDGRDAHDLVEWLATQPFSDGRIGQLGESYGGGTTYGAAVEQPPHLRAIAPMQAPANLYDDVNYPGGIETTQGGTMSRCSTSTAKTPRRS